MSYLPGLLRFPVSKTARSHSATDWPLVAVNRGSETLRGLTGYSRFRRAAQTLPDGPQTVSTGVEPSVPASLHFSTRGAYARTRFLDQNDEPRTRPHAPLLLWLSR